MILNMPTLWEARSKEGFKEFLTITYKTGRIKRVKRCQTWSRMHGGQCRMRARVGFNMCGFHGAGFKVREERGERQPSYGQPRHGFYKRVRHLELEELAIEILNSEEDLNNTDREMAFVKATFVKFLDLYPNLNELGDAVKKATDKLKEQNYDLHQNDLEVLLQLVKEVNTMVAKTMHLYTLATETIKMAKLRVETQAKQAEAKAIEAFTELTMASTKILKDIMSAEDYDRYYTRLHDELFKKIGVNKTPIARPELVLEASNESEQGFIDVNFKEEKQEGGLW